MWYDDSSNIVLPSSERNWQFLMSQWLLTAVSEILTAKAVLVEHNLSSISQILLPDLMPLIEIVHDH